MRSFELESVTLPNGVEISRGTEFLVREQVEYGSKSGECVFCPGEMFQVESLEWVDKQSPEWVGGDETGDVQVNLEENAPVSSLQSSVIENGFSQSL